jgi:hypothetical protein
VQPLCILLCALAILSFPGVCQAQGATDQQYVTELCRGFGQHFEILTVSRDKGISWKDELDSYAKFLQERPVEGIPSHYMVYLAQLMIGNVYYNPLYKHFGPAMNKLTAESRCKQIGAEAFVNELQTFMKK